MNKAGNQVKKFSVVVLGIITLTLMIVLTSCGQKTEQKTLPEETPAVQEPVQPDVPLFLSCSGPRLVYLNKELTYTITVANNAKKPKQASEVTAVIPEECEFVSATPEGVFTPADETSPASVVWQFSDIAPESKVEIGLKLKAAAKGNAVIECRMASPEEEPLTVSVNTKIIGVAAVQISTCDTEDPVEVGGTTSYVVEIRNEGTSPCTNVKLESKVPDKMEFVSAEAPVNFTCESGSVAFEPYPFLPPGGNLIYTITCKVVKEGSTKHTAILTYDQSDQPIIDEEGTSCY